MAALSSIGNLQLFKRSDSGREELEALVDLLPLPTLIVNGRSSQILIANSQASQLSAYTRKELSELELSTLIPEFSSKKITKLLSEDEDPEEQSLITRSSKAIEVVPSFISLGGTEHWFAITLAPSTEIQVKQSEQSRQHERWEAVHLLSLAGQQQELASSFRQILQAGKLLSGASHLALYVQSPEGKELTLAAVAGSGLDFPAALDEADLGRLRSPLIWQAGKPLHSSLHKLAHASKLNYLASSPLDLTQPTNGLIVAAEESKPAAEDILTMLQILAASAATASINRQLVEDVSNRIDHLAQSNQLSLALQANVQDGLLLLNTDLIVEHINPAAVEIFGYSESEAKGLAAADLLISSQPILNALGEAIENGNNLDIGESKLHRRNGNEFPAHLRMAPLSENGYVVNVAVIVNDLSENEALHLHSQQLQKRAWLGEVTAIFAHEVTNPINNISSGLQLLQTDFEKDDPLQEQVKRLLDDCDRLDHQLKQMLSFSQNLKHKPEALDIGEFCRMQLERWQPRMARKNIEHHFQVQENIPLVLGDQRALDQVFTNLITNAIQAMQEQESGVIAIKISGPAKSEGSDYVDIQFSDTGPGIPEELRKRVFDPFFTTKDNGGTGLGLAITKRIIMAHKGKIEIESFPGGTHFKIKLPIATENKG